MAENNYCGEWRDRSITPEQEQRAELVERFALAIVGSDCDETGGRWKPDTVWRMAEDYVDAKPKIGGES
jgi:ketosteroid isomerase-like protein